MLIPAAESEILGIDGWTLRKEQILHLQRLLALSPNLMYFDNSQVLTKYRISLKHMYFRSIQ